MMNPDAINPTPEENIQSNNPSAPPIANAPDAPQVPVNPPASTVSATPQEIASTPVDPSQATATNQASIPPSDDGVASPISATEIPVTAQPTDQQNPAIVPEPTATKPSLNNKLIIMAGLIILGLATLAIVLMLL